jgi:DNA modification methylase
MQVVSIAEIRPNPSNPRLIKDDKFKKLVQSLKDFPEMANVRPIVVNQDMVILGGNMRFKAMKEAKWKQIPVEVVDWNEAKQREFIIKDNVGFGEWDWDDLANNWDSSELDKWGLDVPEFEAQQEEAVEDDYEMPDEIQTDIVLGDLFEIGEHRLLCGDSTDSDAVARLMDGHKADIVVTDPPYNTGMTGKKNDAKARLSHMFNDSFTDEEWSDFLTQIFNNYNLFIKGECALYVFIDWRRVADIKQAVEKIADVKNVIVWDKGVHGLGSDYKSTYENCVVGKKGKPEINNRFGLDYQDIWRVQRTMGRVKEHATQKPIELLSKPIKHASKQDDIVFDLFLGSGSTMVAAHQLKRKCYGMELDPKYCQVIVDRMLKLDPTLTVKRNGQPYLPGGTNQGNNKDAKPGES